MLIADLTGNNFSVGYEFAFAHMVNKPTIPLLKSGSSMPYDVQTMRAVTYDYTSRATLRSSIQPLSEQLKRFKMPHSTDNPLRNALKVVEHETAVPPLKPVIPPMPPPRVEPVPPPPSMAFPNLFKALEPPGKATLNPFNALIPLFKK